jgi:hypothetical protein
MEQTESSETSAFSTWTPGRYPKENALQMKHGESLKSRIKINSYLVIHTKSYKMEDTLLKELGNYST